MSLIFSKNAQWFKAILIIAGVYHILWGLAAVLLPSFFFSDQTNTPTSTELWQVIGFYNAILGFAYLTIASNAIRHWRIVLLGFISKLIIVVLFLNSLFHHDTEGHIIYQMIIVNHIVWLFPFAIILYNAYRHQYLLDNELMRMNHLSTDELLEMYQTSKGNSLVELADKQPVLLVFLRHFGCTFCKETLYSIGRFRTQIEEQGTKIVLVNMLDEKRGIEQLTKYNLDDLDYISDPETLLYKAFRLKRGTLSELIGLKVWIRAIYLWITKGAFVSSPEGTDVYQMPGIFLIYQGAVIKQFIHTSSSDNPPYLELASCDNCIKAPSF